MADVTALTKVVLATPTSDPRPPVRGDLESLVFEAFGIGKTSGGDVAAAAGDLTIPAGYTFSIAMREPERATLLRLFSPVVIAAAENDELFATLTETPTGLQIVLDVAATTPAGSLKLGDATGSPVDTFTQTDRSGGLQ